MRDVASSVYAFVNSYLSWVNIRTSMDVIDVVEIIIIAFVLYYIMAWIKNTRAWMLFKGIMAIVVFLVIAAFFQMSTIIWLANKIANIAVIALVIIFQPELRSALERLGRKTHILGLFNIDIQRAGESRMSEKTINDLVRASYDMGRVKTGALMVIERDVMLSEYIRTGIELDSLISSQLIINIFEHNTPLHDGAVIVRGDRIVSATCYLPLSDNMQISKELGTRHRAAVGISEVSDSLTIIVSEETGSVSVAMNGTITRNVSEEELKKLLRAAAGAGISKENIVKKLKRRLKSFAKNKKADSK